MLGVGELVLLLFSLGIPIIVVVGIVVVTIRLRQRIHQLEVRMQRLEADRNALSSTKP
jgi:cell division protein FtsB